MAKRPPDKSANIYTRSLKALGVKTRTERIIVTITLCSLFALFAYFPIRSLASDVSKKQAAWKQQEKEFAARLDDLKSTVAGLREMGFREKKYNEENFEVFKKSWINYSNIYNEANYIWPDKKWRKTRETGVEIRIAFDTNREIWEDVIRTNTYTDTGAKTKLLLMTQLNVNLGYLENLLHNFEVQAEKGE